MNLENLGVQGMSATEMKNIDGGNQPASTYMTQESIEACGEMFSDFCRGVAKGFMSCW